MGEIYDGGFEARKAHVERAAVDFGARQLVNVARAFVGEPIHCRAAGIGETEHARGLIEAFARRVVARRTEQDKVRIAAHIDDERVAAGHTQRQKRRLELGKG